MTEALTGNDAAEAIAIAVDLGNRDVRFDGRRVLRELRTRAGRLRVGASLALGARACRYHVETVRRGRGPERRPGRVQRPAAAAAAPGRPSATPAREAASHGLA